MPLTGLAQRLGHYKVRQLREQVVLFDGIEEMPRVQQSFARMLPTNQGFDALHRRAVRG